MSNKLPKHIAQMVEKNNLVLAIKSLSKERNISMGEAKEIIDEFEQQLKQQQAKKVASISRKQDKKKVKTESSQSIKNINQSNKNINHSNKSINQTKKDNPNFQQLNKGLDKHLDSMGYKKPLLPYWMKRLLIILVIMTVLIFIFWQLVP